VSRPVHLRVRYLGVVAIGGAIGTGLRAALSLAIPTPGGFPLGILIINLVGAMFLGFLLEGLARRGPDEGGRRTLRLFLGTGAAGGFTTYSSLATEGALLIGTHPALGLLYVLGTVLVGAVATVVGILLGAAASRRRREAA
jgi:fluoride exporter